MCNSGVFFIFVHQDVSTGMGCGRSKQIDVDPGRVKHHQRMPAIESAIHNKFETKAFVEGHGLLPVADANSDVVESLNVQHGGTFHFA